MTPHLSGIDHVHVFVRDRKVAERWYAQVLGLTRSPRLEFWAADGGPLTVQDTANTVHIALFEREPQPNRTTIALRTSAAELHTWLKHLRTSGVLVELEDHQVSFSIYFSDPDDNPYEITTYEYAAFAAPQ
jgi:catechol-2,3-dioxygenase